MQIIKKHFYELTPKERTELRNTCIRGAAYGMSNFLGCQHKRPHVYMGFVFLLYSNKRLVAWSAIIEPPYGDIRQIWVYVKRSHRRAGIGTTLFKLAKRKGKRFHVKPWNETGYKFFKANKKAFAL